MTKGANDSVGDPGPRQDLGGQGLRATVLERLTNGLFRLQTTDGREVVAHAAMHLRMAIVRLLPGDAVAIDVSPFDPNKARIRSLLKSQHQNQHDPSPSQPKQREQS